MGGEGRGGLVASCREWGSAGGRVVLIYGQSSLLAFSSPKRRTLNRISTPSFTQSFSRLFPDRVRDDIAGLGV